MVSASEFTSRLFALLARAAAACSSRLSVAALAGLALAAVLPGYATSIVAPKAAPPPVERASAKVLADAGPAAPAPPPPVQHSGAATSEVAGPSILQIATRRSRGEPPAQPKPESGSFGKGAAPAEKTPVAPAEAKTAAPEAQPPPDVWSDAEIIAALRDCLELLAPLGAEIEIAEPVKRERCGAPAAVLLERIGTGADRVEFRPPPMLNCAMVAGLHAWVTETLQPAAREVLGSPVVRIRNASGYVCRNRVGSLYRADRLSEHAFANAIDIAGFVTADGRTIDVLKAWGPILRDLRDEEERIAEAAAKAKTAAKEAEREAAQAAAAVAKAARDKRQQAEAASKQAEAERKQAEAEAASKKAEAEGKQGEAEKLEAERREVRQRIARLARLERSLSAKAIPVSSRTRPTRLRRSKEEEGDAGTPIVLPPGALFLRRLHRGACDTFGTVLGPEANEAHRNHFHFDLAERKRRALCQ